VARDERPVVVFSGGGTGGHLYPALALAEALAEVRPDVRAVFVGAERGVEARVLPARGVEHVLLPVLGFARGEGLSAWRAVPALLRSLHGVAELFQRTHPALVVVTGGYAGAPAGIMAALRRVPLALQEQNSVPGVTTRLLARVADQIHIAFPETLARLPSGARARAVRSGNPIRPPAALDRREARRAFGLEAEATTMLVVGGSQGSLALNRGLLDALAGVSAGRLHRPARLQLLWSTGPAHLQAIQDGLAELGAPDWVHPVGYIDHMDQALAAADFAVSRAGAMATSEFLAWGLPAILVPLPSAAADHQTENARSLAEAGAAVHLPQASLTGEGLWQAVLDLAGSQDRLDAARDAALERARPDAARRIAERLDLLLPRHGAKPRQGALDATPGDGSAR